MDLLTFYLAAAILAFIVLLWVFLVKKWRGF